MFEKFRPLNNNVWVKIQAGEEKTAGGLYIPDSAKTDNQTGSVIAVGQGSKKQDGTVIPMQVKVGDKVFFGKYAGVKAGDEYLVLKEEDILGIIEQ